MNVPVATSPAVAARILSVLHVEDSEDDAILVLHELAEGGFSVSSHRVETARDMQAALERDSWNLVISDFKLPRFSAMEALEVLRVSGSRLPCIVVSGAIGEEAAVALMKAGASDFVMKQRLSRLGPAVERTLREADTRRAHRIAIEAQQQSEARFEAIAAHLPGVVFQAILYPDADVRLAYVSNGCRAVLGVDASTLMANPKLLLEMIVPEDRASFWQARQATVTQLLPRNWEGRIRLGADCNIKWINLRAGSRRLDSGGILSEGIITNITESKLAQESMRRSREQLRQLAIHVDKVKEQERAHIAREIHDDLGGTLLATKIDLACIRSRLPPEREDLLEKTSSMEALLDSAIATSTRISRRLRPLVLDHGITAAIEWQAREFAKRMGIPCNYACPAEDIGLPSDLATALFRVFQETLTNIAKHAGARCVDVALEETEGEVRLTVQDDGCGITPADMQKPGSYGLRGMRERVDSLGGRLKIAGDTIGTSVEVRIPIGQGLPREAPADGHDVQY